MKKSTILTIAIINLVLQLLNLIFLSQSYPVISIIVSFISFLISFFIAVTFDVAIFGSIALTFAVSSIALTFAVSSIALTVAVSSLAMAFANGAVGDGSTKLACAIALLALFLLLLFHWRKK